MSAKKLYKLKQNMKYMNQLPTKGKLPEEVAKMVNNYLGLDNVDWEGGRVSGTVYSGDAKLNDVVSDVYKKFTWTNPLHPDVFPSIRFVFEDFEFKQMKVLILALMTF